MTKFKNPLLKLGVLPFALICINAGFVMLKAPIPSESSADGMADILVPFTPAHAATKAKKTAAKTDECGGSNWEFYEAQKKDIRKILIHKNSRAKFASFKNSKIHHDKNCMYYIESYVMAKDEVGSYGKGVYYAVYLRTDHGYERMGHWEKAALRKYPEVMASMYQSMPALMKQMGLNAKTRPNNKFRSLDLIESPKDELPLELTLFVERPFNTVLGYEVMFSTEDMDPENIENDYDTAYKLVIVAMNAITPGGLSDKDEKTLRFYLDKNIDERWARNLPKTTQRLYISRYIVDLVYAPVGEGFRFHIAVQRNRYDEAL